MNQSNQSKLSIAYQIEQQKNSNLTKQDIFNLGKCPGHYSLGPKWDDHCCEYRLEIERGYDGLVDGSICRPCWGIKNESDITD